MACIRVQGEVQQHLIILEHPSSFNKRCHIVNCQFFRVLLKWATTMIFSEIKSTDQQVNQTPQSLVGSLRRCTCTVHTFVFNFELCTLKNTWKVAAVIHSTSTCATLTNKSGCPYNYKKSYLSAVITVHTRCSVLYLLRMGLLCNSWTFEHTGRYIKPHRPLHYVC